jgi:hypothetical protein
MAGIPLEQLESGTERLDGRNPTILVAEIWPDQNPAKVVGFRPQSDSGGGRLYRLKER